MKRNVEIKARVEDLDRLERLVRELADDGPAELRQEDTFFAPRTGRLKLRRLSESYGELIFYTRPDNAMPSESSYALAPTSAPEDLLNVLTQSLGARGVVKKRRSLYLIGQTRVHLDRVEGLGEFVELEVVLRPDQEASHGISIVRELMEVLGIDDDTLVNGAYIDLLEKASKPAP